MPATLDRPHLSTSQAARQLQLTDRWLRELVRRGDVEAIQTPLGLLFDADAIRRIAAERAARDGSEG